MTTARSGSAWHGSIRTMRTDTERLPRSGAATHLGENVAPQLTRTSTLRCGTDLRERRRPRTDRSGAFALRWR